MAELSANDNPFTPFGDHLNGVQAEGRAALLLAESLLHGLVARSQLSVEEAIDIVEVAADVIAELICDRGDPDGSLQRSHFSLGSTGASLAIDLRGK